MKRNLSRTLLRNLTWCALAAVTVEAGKLAFAALPNVEVVTLLLALYGYVLGGWGILASLLFVAVEPMIWGVGTWIFLYIIYWPLLTAVFALLGRKKVHGWVVPTLIAVGMTVFFGVLSAFIDVGLFMGRFDRFWARFAAYYARGIVFYLIQIATNAVLFPLLFVPLSRLLERLTAGDTSSL